MSEKYISIKNNYEYTMEKSYYYKAVNDNIKLFNKMPESMVLLFSWKYHIIR